ncbi:hypothetical protein [Asticcacaulis sp. YBE204]|uniref:hypothetical protein n=1 Tax=Asticcacaulis sp. YBE204 TaxID=1282363 RepID=UPI0003C4068A|nr:hypothetical protein [Asticcacaulis sp. YBE204]ESQ76908.1 hypothetical protein AEYBE204_18705 [Asticcacaulis sp. YBE204]
MMHNDPAFEVIMRHLNLNEEAAHVWVDYIAKFTYGESAPIYDLLHDINNLENLDRALTTVVTALEPSTMTGAAHNRLNMRISFGAHLENISGQRLDTLDESILKYIEIDGKAAHGSLRALEENIANIRTAIRLTKRDIEQSKSSVKGISRINLDGVQLVNSARDVWKLSTGKTAPARGLNPASPFGKFLYDLFEAFEIPGDAKSAFTAWVKHVHTSG